MKSLHKLYFPLAALFCVAANLSAQAQDYERQTLETITVTGEKQDKSLMETSSSVEVFDERELEEREGLDSVSEILAIVPNFVGTETTNFAPAVRGADGTGPAQGADAFFAGTRPRLNYQLDGRTLSYNESIFSDATVWDIERVEVFRGPQSTLQGRNAVAGAVVVKSNDPVYDFETGGRVLVGDYSTRQYSGYVSGPIVDNQVAYRVAVDHRDADSFTDFEPFIGIDDPEEQKSSTVRAKLLLEPAALPDFDALITYSYVDAHSPQGADVERPFGDLNAAFPAMPRFGTRANTVIVDSGHDINQNFRVEALLSFTDLEVARISNPGAGIVDLDADEFVAEPRLVFDFNDAGINGFLGTHHFRNEQDEFIDLFGGGTFDDETTTDAVFGEATWNFAEQWDLTFGGRWEREHRERNGGVFIFLIDFDETYEVFLPKGVLSWRPTETLTVGASVARGYNGGSAGFTFEPPFVSYTYDEEYVWTYELFSRAELMDGRLQLTANAFYSDWKDMQLPFDLNADPDIWSFVVRNADGAESYGLELGSRFLVADGLDVYANLGLLEAEVTTYPGSGIEGHNLPRSPTASLNIGGYYTHRSGFEFGVDARWSDSYDTDVINEPAARVDSYWVAGAQVAWRFSKVRVFASVTNIFDNVEPVLFYPGVTSADDTATILEPRMVSMGVSVDL